jgi:endonuclease/exonuclease/phosphatase family metal-dependent hydrolase
MSQLKIATWNTEWMVSIFGGLWKEWQSPFIPDTFKGKTLGTMRLDPIADVPGLCQRMAGVIKDMGALIIGIQEAPPLKEQMEVFVHRFLGDEYVVHYSNSNLQTICALVHRSISDRVTALDPKGPETKLLRSAVPYYTWGGVTLKDQKSHHFDRYPLVLDFSPEGGKGLRVIVVHTKSKHSKLTLKLWEKRDRAAILDALDARRKLSAEVSVLRQFLDNQLEPPNENKALVVVGDCNDGPGQELMEQEFLVHNIIDEVVGSLLYPTRHFRHAMEPDVLAVAASTYFTDPFQGGQIKPDLIDHILVSPGIWQKTSPFKLKKKSCRVETKIYDKHNAETESVHERSLRPSDHRPISAVITY